MRAHEGLRPWSVPSTREPVLLFSHQVATDVTCWPGPALTSPGGEHPLGTQGRGAAVRRAGSAQALRSVGLGVCRGPEQPRQPWIVLSLVSKDISFF